MLNPDLGTPCQTEKQSHISTARQLPCVGRLTFRAHQGQLKLTGNQGRCPVIIHERHSTFPHKKTNFYLFIILMTESLCTSNEKRGLPWNHES